MTKQTHTIKETCIESIEKGRSVSRTFSMLEKRFPRKTADALTTSIRHYAQILYKEGVIDEKTRIKYNPPSDSVKQICWAAIEKGRPLTSITEKLEQAFPGRYTAAELNRNVKYWAGRMYSLGAIDAKIRSKYLSNSGLPAKGLEKKKPKKRTRVKK